MKKDLSKLSDFEFVIAAAAAGTWILDLTTNKNKFDDRALEIYGLTRETFDNTYEAWLTVVHPDDIEEANSLFQKAVAAGGHFTSHHRAIKPNGEIVYVEGQGLMRTDENGKSIGALGLVFDETERVLREQELALEKERAEAANKAKSTFLANMSHELRTPLNVVLGFSEILRRKEKDEKKQRYLDVINAAGHTLLSLINDVLDMSKIESGKKKLVLKPTSLSTTCLEIGDMFQKQTTGKDIDFLVEIDPALPDKLLMDDICMRQILLNLSNNAIKFTDRGQVNLIVEATPVSAGSIEIVLRVRDTGKGIPKDQHDKIFDEFEQVTGQDINKYGGTGLGLAITKKLVKLMGGKISLTSTVGIGSEFVITFPAIEIAATPIEIPKSKGEEIDFETLTFDQATILIVDDVAHNRDLLRAYLTPYGFDIIEAENGKIAIEKVLQQSPDLILMDLKMPQMNGFEACQHLRSIPETRVIPIVVVTASIISADEEKINDFCNSFLRKPVSKIEIMRMLMEFLPHHFEDLNDRKSHIDHNLP